MPRIKPLTERERMARQIKADILAGMAIEGKTTAKEASEATGIAYDTWLRRMANPEKFTLEEILKIKRVFPAVKLSI